jgi:chemotaxis protein MotB
LIDPKALPLHLTQSGIIQISAPGRDENESTHEDQALPQGLSEAERRKIAAEQDEKNFENLQAKLKAQVAGDTKTADLLSLVKFVKEKEGLRIEILDSAGFSMFSSGTNSLAPEAKALIQKVGESLKGVPNEIAVRRRAPLPTTCSWEASGNNNWALSANRADATRKYLSDLGVDDTRFSRAHRRRGRLATGGPRASARSEESSH